MTVRSRQEGGLELAGVCGSEDAEALLSRLLADPRVTVDWRACDAAHTAVVQVLLASRISPVGPPRGVFLVEIVEPMLKRR